MRNRRLRGGHLVAAPALIFISALLAFPSLAQWGASGSVFSQDGIEISVDGRVFAIFAALNHHGFNREREFGKPPLNKPLFSASREKVRGELNRPGPALRQFEAIFARFPLPVEAYTAAALELEQVPSLKAPKSAGKLAKALSNPAADWFSEEGGFPLFQEAAKAAKADQKSLLKKINAATGKLSANVNLGDSEEQLLDDEGPKGRVVVTLNPLDSHGSLYRVTSGDSDHVVVGPLSNKKDRKKVVSAVKVAFARSLVAGPVDAAFKKGAYAKAFGALTKSEKARVGGAKGFAREIIACAVSQWTFGDNQCVASPGADKPAVKAQVAALVSALKADAKGKHFAEVAKSLMSVSGKKAAAPSKSTP